MSETFLILRRNERDMIKMYIGLHVKDRLFLSDFKKNLNFLDRFSKKYSDIKFHENPVSESRAVPCGRTDRQIRRSQESLFAILQTRLTLIFSNQSNLSQLKGACHQPSYREVAA